MELCQLGRNKRPPQKGERRPCFNVLFNVHDMFSPYPQA
ncbi:hypothetical protein BF49_2861 [Bradyrhizobium sp.]|nr:hypothetical protein BF49_2861 [Bradyrhizobium sp.]